MLKNLGSASVIAISLFACAVIFQQAQLASAQSLINDPTPGGMCGCMSCNCYMVDGAIADVSEQELLSKNQADSSVIAGVGSRSLTASLEDIHDSRETKTVNAQSSSNSASGATKNTASTPKSTTTSAPKTTSSATKTTTSSATKNSSGSPDDRDSSNNSSNSSNKSTTSPKPANPNTSTPAKNSSGSPDDRNEKNKSGSPDDRDTSSKNTKATETRSGSSQQDFFNKNPELYAPYIDKASYEPNGVAPKLQPTKPSADFKGMGDNVKDATESPTTKGWRDFYGGFYKIDPATGQRVVNVADTQQKPASSDTQPKKPAEKTGSAKVLSDHPTWSGPITGSAGCPSGETCYKDKNGRIINDKGIPVVDINR